MEKSQKVVSWETPWLTPDEAWLMNQMRSVDGKIFEGKRKIEYYVRNIGGLVWDVNGTSVKGLIFSGQIKMLSTITMTTDLKLIVSALADAGCPVERAIKVGPSVYYFVTRVA